MKPNILGLVLCGSLLLNASSDVFLEDKSSLMQGKYIEIREFSRLNYNTGVLSEESRNYFEALVYTIKSYIEDKKNIKIEVAGHVSARKDIYGKVIVGEEVYIKSLEDNKKFAQEIAKELEDNNIAKESINLSYKSSKDLGFNSVTKEGRDISHRVMVTMYVMPSDINKQMLSSNIEVPMPLVYPQKLMTPKAKVEAVVVVDTVKKVDTKPMQVKEEIKIALVETKHMVEPKIEPIVPEKVITPLVIVHKDTDEDGITDNMDSEINTPQKYVVDNSGRAKSIRFSTNFEKKDASLPEDLTLEVMRLASYLTKNPEIKIRVVGHTSRTKVSGKVYNIRLSLQRAKRIQSELKKYGINQQRILVDGKGFSLPIADNATEEGRIENRRVDIEFIRKDKVEEK